MRSFAAAQDDNIIGSAEWTLRFGRGRNDVKGREAHQLSTEELSEKLRDAYQEMFNLRIQKSTRELTNFARVTEVRKDIARFKTILRERELGAIAEPAVASAAEE